MPEATPSPMSSTATVVRRPPSPKPSQFVKRSRVAQATSAALTQLLGSECLPTTSTLASPEAPGAEASK